MNRNLISTRNAPAADTVSPSGTLVHTLQPKEAMAQLAVTGCLGDTFYASAESQLSEVGKYLDLLVSDPVYLAKLAIYARTSAFMKDMPAVILAQMAGSVAGGIAGAPGPLYRNTRNALVTAFPRVIDNGKMLRNFVQAVRSGKFGRRSLGSMPSRLINTYLTSLTPAQLLRHCIGSAPSLIDIIRLSHPSPKDAEQAAIFRYLIRGLEGDMPHPWNGYLDVKNGKVPVHESDPQVPWELLTNYATSKQDWIAIMYRMGWHALRMNVNTLLRHGALLPRMSNAAAHYVAEKLRDPEAVKNARVFPYQIMTAYLNINPDVPRCIIDALHDAMEISASSVCTGLRDLSLGIIVDVSGSMSYSSITGYRKGATSCISVKNVASLVSVTLARSCANVRLLPVDVRVYYPKFEPRDTIMTSANMLSRFGGNGTYLHLGIEALSKYDGPRFDGIIIVSDNESWGTSRFYPGATNSVAESLRKYFPKTKAVLIDLTPHSYSMSPSSPRILNIGGFSDSVFPVIESFLTSDENRNFTSVIESIPLDVEVTI